MKDRTRTLALVRAHFPLLFVLLPFFIGQALGALINFTGLLLLVVASALIYAYVRKGRWWLLLLGYFALGSVSSLLAIGQLREVRAGEAIFVGEVVGEIRSRRAGELLFPVRVLSYQGDQGLADAKVSCRAIDLPGRNAAALKLGDRRWFRAAIEPWASDNFLFGFAAFQRRQGISGSCRVRYMSVALPETEASTEIFKDSVTEILWSVLGDDEVVGLIRASLLGVHDTLGSKTEEAFRHTGLTHLVVVSGYQVGILYSLGYLIAQCLIRGRYGRTVASLVGAWLALSYAAILGFEYTVFRASVAIGVFVVAKELERDRRPVNALLTAALVVSIVWPCSLLDLSLQLTFAALSGLAFGGHLTRFKGPSLRYLSVSLCGGLLPMLVLALWGLEFGAIGLFLNPIVAPIFSFFSVPVVLVGLGAQYLWPDLAAWILGGAYYVLFAIRELVHMMYALGLPKLELGMIGRIVLALTLLLVTSLAALLWCKRLYVTRGVV